MELPTASLWAHLGLQNVRHSQAEGSGGLFRLGAFFVRYERAGRPWARRVASGFGVGSAHRSLRPALRKGRVEFSGI